MNAPVRRVSVAVLVLFALLFVNLNYVQFVQADKLRRNDGNKRLLLQTYDRQRGSIVVDGKAIAASIATNDKLKYLRTYPGGPIYAHITGYYSLVYGSSAIEHAEDPVLTGDDDRLLVRRVSDLITTGRTPRGGDVVLTLNPEAQTAAANMLRGRRGSVVAIDPRSGAILTMVSSPTYDPGPLASHDVARIKAAWTPLANDPKKPLLNRAVQETYSIGSTMKVIISTVALQNGYSPDTEIPAPRTYTPPLTSVPLPNYDGTSCSGSGKQTLADALRVSCNTAFAGLGVKLGADKIKAQAAQFGVGDKLDIPMRVAVSDTGALADPPQIAQSSIGQRDIRFTPLQNCMVAAAVANNGTLNKPYLIQELDAPGLQPIERATPTVLHRPMSPSVASQLQGMMVGVIENGTGKLARIPGYVVGGKTGTAQNAGPDHGWFIGFAGKEGQAPPIAIAVVLEQAGRGGSHDASLIAGKVMQAYLGSPSAH
ncbi:MAG: penicillin-binding transpeptidase domain-containing protein [Pseudonocardiales bacterium]